MLYLVSLYICIMVKDIIAYHLPKVPMVKYSPYTL